jgi:hypothetical protein
LVIHVFRKSKHLQTPLNVLVIGCSIIDITMLLVGLPFLIASSFYGYWVFGSAWCEGYGFVMTLMGVSSICILSAIALDRYLSYVMLVKLCARTLYASVRTRLVQSGVVPEVLQHCDLNSCFRRADYHDSLLLYTDCYYGKLLL